MPETDRRMILNRDRGTMGHEVVTSLNSDLLNKERFTCSKNDLFSGQPHQLTRRLLRIGSIAKLGDEELLDEVLIGEIFGQNS